MHKLHTRSYRIYMVCKPDELPPLRVSPNMLVIEIIESAKARSQWEDEKVRVIGENRRLKVVSQSHHCLVSLEVRHAMKDRKILQGRQKCFESCF